MRNLLTAYTADVVGLLHPLHSFLFFSSSMSFQVLCHVRPMSLHIIILQLPELNLPAVLVSICTFDFHGRAINQARASK